MIAQLQKKIMQQATEKGWGTQLHKVNVLEKILLIGSEAFESGLSHTKHKKILDAEWEFWRSPLHHPEEPSWSSMFYNPGFQSRYHDKSKLRESYQEEWADALQRILHLGGIFKKEFPEPYTYSFKQIPDLRDEARRREVFHKKIYQATNFYRHKEIPKFLETLVWLSQYCYAIAEKDNFDIERTSLDKIRTNQQRIWSKSDFNETLLS